jgi:hypothetical protein
MATGASAVDLKLCLGRGLKAAIATTRSNRVIEPLTLGLRPQPRWYRPSGAGELLDLELQAIDEEIGWIEMQRL